MSIRRMMLFTLGAKIKNLIQAFKERVLATQGEFEAEACLDVQLTELNNDNLLDSASFIVTPNGYRETLLYAVEPNEVGTNLVLRSEEFDNASIWQNQILGTGVNPIRIANAAISPDGTQNADRITFNRGAGNTITDQSVINQQITISTAGTYIFSVWLKASASEDVGKQVFIRCGNGSPLLAVTLTAFWVRFQISASVTASSNSFQIGSRGTFTLNNIVTADIWGAQLVQGSTITNYISTTDRAIINGTIGDMSVTRATTGTRVNADGLIEQVPYNLLSRSEEFENASWIKNESSIINNSTISPSGVQNADSLIENTATALHQCIFTTSEASGTYTATIYAKPNGRNWLFFNIAAAANYGVWFDIQNGVVGTIQSNITSASITNAGNGWYRCIITANTGAISPRISLTLSIGNNNTSYLGNGTSGIFIWGAQLVTGTQPRDYFPTTNRFNVPRIDYSNGSCPSILVEPQRTNLVLQSNNFNTTWLLFSGASIIPNSAISPEGIQNATTLNSSGGVNDFLYQVIPITNGVTYTNSFYIKNINSTSSKYRIVNNGENIINWSGATLVSISGTGTSSFVAVGNGWYRVSTTVASTSTSYIYRIFSDNSNTSKSVYIYGAQLEVGANATSYIPTVASTVTRNADVIDNTNMSTLIGQTEGAMYIDFNYQRVNPLADSYIATISDGTISNSLLFSVLPNQNFAVFIRTAGINVIFISIPAASFTFGRKKIVISYKSGETKLYVNGVKIGPTITNAFTFPVTINKFNLGSSWIGGGLVNNTINSAVLYKTVLTDSQAIQLTTL